MKINNTLMHKLNCMKFVLFLQLPAKSVWIAQAAMNMTTNSSVQAAIGSTLDQRAMGLHLVGQVCQLMAARTTTAVQLSLASR